MSANRSDGTQSTREELRQGIYKPTGTIGGENTNAGAQANPGDSDVLQHDIKKQTEDLGKEDLSRDSSSLPSACLSVERVAGELDEKTIVTFDKDDPSNPYNWGRGKKTHVLLTCMALVLNSTIGSALPSGATEEIRVYFGVENQSLLVLPVSIYLIGYVLGPLCFAPLSEWYGRKWTVIATFVIFTAFHLGCALAPTFSGLIIMRLLVGIGASTPVSVIGGIYADIYSTPKARGRAVTGFMVATTWGPLASPIISGFVAPTSWRWAFWSGLIIAGATWPFVLFLPETYGPVLLKRKAAKIRKKTGKANVVAPIELEDQSWKEFITVVLTRPVRMFLFEWIVLFSCLYLSVAYAIFYIFFQSYPIIFGGIYGFNAGETGLTFLPIGVGAMLAGFVHVWWEIIWNERKREHPHQVGHSRKSMFVCP